MTIKLLIENFKKRINHERGQAFILVLILMLFGALIIVPLLNVVSTGLKTGTVYEKKTNELYAADSGINNGQWQVQNEMPASGLQAGSPPYAPYDFSSSWPLQTVTNNGTYPSTVNATINNEWMFNDLAGGLALPTPSSANAERLINGFGNPVTPPKIAITSSITAPFIDSSHPGTLEIKIQYRPPANPEDLEIKTLGIWLPPGYTYAGGNNIGPNYNATVNNSPYKGGTAVIWSFGGGYPFEGVTGPPVKNPFPGVDPNGSPPLVSKVTFQFTATAPTANLSPPLAWIDTNLDLTQGGSPSATYTWDGNVLVYHIHSIATTPSGTSTTVDTYVTKYQLRTVTASVNGDYTITGGSLMNDADLYDNIRESVKSSSSNTIQTKDPSDTASNKIPSNATVLSAILYWSGWLNQSRSNAYSLVFDNYSQWSQTGTIWSSSAGVTPFTGHYNTGGDPARYLTLNSGIDLSGLRQGDATLSWTQSVTPYVPVTSPVPPLNPDTADNFNNWNNGSAWVLNSGNFKGNGGSGGKDLTLKNALNLSTYGTTGTINLSLDTPGLATLTQTSVPPLNPDPATNFNNWNNGNAWSLTGTSFKGGGGASGKDLTLKNALLNLGQYGSTGSINVTVDPPTLANLPQTTVFSDIGSSTNLTNFWTNGGDWSYYSNNYRATHTGADSRRYLTLKNALNLSTYATAGTINLSLDTPVLAQPTQSTAFTDAGSSSNLTNNWTNGGDWSYYSGLYRGHHYPSSNPATYRDLVLKAAIPLSSYASTGTINITWSQSETGYLGSGDGLDFGYSLDGGGTWTTMQAFRDDNPSGTNGYSTGPITFTNNFLIKFTVINCTSSSQYVNIDNINVSVTPSYASTDGLNLAYSLDGGTNWTTNSVFTGNLNGLTTNWTIPSGNLSGNFLIRFYLAGFNYSWQYCYIDNINVKVTPSYAGTDGLNYSYSLNGGTTWTTNSVFTGNLVGLTTSWTIPNGTLPGNFLIKFSLVGFVGSGQYCYLDNINVSVTPSYATTDGLDLSYSLNGGSSWVALQVFRGNLGSLTTNWNITDVPLSTTFLLKFSLVGFVGSGQWCTIDNIKVMVTPSHTETDALLFSFYDSAHSTWSDNLSITSPYTIPAGYLNSNFKMRLYLQGFSMNGESCSVDNITIAVDSGLLPSDNRIVFNLNGNSQTITVDPYDPQQVISKGVINGPGFPDGYYYACRQNVTDIIKQFSSGANWNANPKVDGNGSGTYTLSPVAGDILADAKGSTNNSNGTYDANAYSASSYAGWSLVIIYSSPETKSNYLKLYDWNYWPDKFSVSSNLADPHRLPYTWRGTWVSGTSYLLNDTVSSANLNYFCIAATNGTTDPGSDGTHWSRANVFDVPITGFVVPKQETGETDAAKVTVFVGEGDPQIVNDYVALIDQSNPTTENPLWDRVTLNNSSYTSSNTQTNPRNVWNGQSAEFPADAGVDIDTFHILWNDPDNGVTLKPDDTLANMRFYTNGDGYVLIYMITSFRSTPTVGGSLIYTIK
jgi:hypothetical protein